MPFPDSAVLIRFLFCSGQPVLKKCDGMLYGGDTFAAVRRGYGYHEIDIPDVKRADTVVNDNAVHGELALYLPGDSVQPFRGIAVRIPVFYRFDQFTAGVIADKTDIRGNTAAIRGFGFIDYSFRRYGFIRDLNHNN